MKKLKTVKEILEYLYERFEEVGKIEVNNSQDLWAKVAILDELDSLIRMIEE